MSDAFNRLVDVGAAAGLRLLELPALLLVALLALAVVAVAVVARLLRRRRGGAAPAARPLPWVLAFLALAALLLIDARLAGLQRQLREVTLEVERLQLRQDAAAAARAFSPVGVPEADRAPLPVGAPPPAPADDRPVPAADRPPELGSAPPGTPAPAADAGSEDAARVRGVLGDCEVRRIPQAPGIDYLWIRKAAPDEAQAHLAIVDLRRPGLTIRITPQHDRKWLTSDFARQTGCIVAINGEAGHSPALDSGLGKWKGNWIVEGRPVLLEDDADRPFLGFDQANHARYYRAALVDREVTPQKWNCIWGRGDLLVEGKVVARKGWPTPRCAMGIDAAGATLFLLIVDGRQPGLSKGLDLPTTARLLAAFGATDAMHCDQGGSACMFLSSRGGIASKPCDAEGERPTYSHFGISR